MAETIILPKLGLTMEEGTVAGWRKQVGEAVQKGEVLLDVETDKATVEIESQFDGVLLAVLVPAGQTVPVTTPIGYIGRPGEAVPGTAAPAPATAPPAALAPPAPVAAPPAALAPPAPAPEPPTLEASAPEAPAPGAVTRGVRASPSARRLARERGVDLRLVQGSGPAGRIQARDVEAHAAAAPPAPAPGSETPAAAVREVPLGGRRKVIAERLHAAFHGAVPVTLTTTVLMTRAVELRQALLPEVEARAGVRLSIADVILRAAIVALRNHPALNATFDGRAITYHQAVHAGLAVNLPDGLVVPVIRNADGLGLAELAGAARAVAERARSGRIGPDDLAGGTFTITNLGAYGIETFTPVLNPPQAAILGVGRVAERPANVAGRLELAPTLNLSLTFDHRVTDGAPAAAFLDEVRRLLEDPYRLWL